MSKLRRALRERRQYRERLLTHRQRAHTASFVLQAEYRRHSLLILSAAGAAGFLAGRHSDRVRPPKPMLRAAFSWSMILLRGLL